FLEPGQPRVDGPRRGRVDAHETVLKEPDDLVAVPRCFIQQLEQVEAQPAVAEHWAHGRPLSAPSVYLTRYIALPESPDTSEVGRDEARTPGVPTMLRAGRPRVSLRRRAWRARS